ncbi:hypothetical protein GUJ93_ZPchr0008g13331 [Zizania palustris]|uniref:Esterase n=1 Tax=Zizania palustris TaxID=103762 RepID=A0A8J5RAE4_ZIZPA|nr:hypothetical protein GUJ93_ZPchr0008g13331 [Zizania palustris]
MTMNLLRVVVVLLLPCISSCLPSRRYDSIFSFGDSFADTGNDAVVFAEQWPANRSTRPPYGMTFFGHPTGRYSNGRLIIDFIAEKLGLPFVPPFLSHNGSFRQGANFAVSGATTLDASFFSDIPIVRNFFLNISSSVQLGWFDSLKPSLCSPAQECNDFLHKSLFFMGEFGVNDYDLTALGKTLPEVRSLVPVVVKTISLAIERLIRQSGAKVVVVPGMPPLGCTPPNLAMFPSTDPSGYEPDTGCLKNFNEIAVHHNTLLQDALHGVRRRNQRAGVRIIYADFFTPVLRIVRSPATFGFTGDILRCCCGGGGKYNFNGSAGCGMPGATVCEDPSTHLFWDGHMTEAAYRIIADGWLNSIVKS